MTKRTWFEIKLATSEQKGLFSKEWGAVMAAEGNAAMGDDSAAYESLSMTAIFEENEAVRVFFESIGYTY